MAWIKKFLGSKKWVTAVIAVFVALVGMLGWDLTIEQVSAAIAPLIAYVVGQGIADHGKEAALVAKPISPDDTLGGLPE